MEKIKVESLRIRVNNTGDEERKHDIACTVNISAGTVTEVTEGQVIKDHQVVADFNYWSSDQGANYTFRGIEAAEKAEVLAEIETFVAQARDFAVSTANVEF